MKIIASILQESYTAHPTPPDETCAPEELRRQCEMYKESTLEPQITLAQQAVQAGSGLIVFREDCNGTGNLAAARLDRPDLFDMLAEPIPGPTSERIGEIARAGNCYVVTCFFEKLDGKVFNTALLLDPRGKVTGKYHKIQLPPVERLMTTPGDDLPVFDTEIGRIGMLVCYDMMTPEVARCLALKGADILCWPSLGYGWWDESGDFTVQSRAHDNQVYLLGALPTHSCIVDPYGDFLAKAGLNPATIISAEIELGADPLQDPLHTNTFLTDTPSLRERHLFERLPELYGAIVDPHPEAMDRYPDTHMFDLERDRQAAFERYRAAQDRLHWQTRKDRTTH
jgi:predicted amidohydrolase